MFILVRAFLWIPRVLLSGLLAGAFLLPAQTGAAPKRWREYTDCTILPHKGNDGDSFHVDIGSLKSAKAKHKLIRLYFVDTPESEYSLPDRLEMQREYWGLPDSNAVVQCGKEAKKFTEEFLKDGFTLYSRLADALGRSRMDRDAGLVWANGRDLGIELVRAGYARIGGFTTDMTGLQNYEMTAGAYQKKLRQAEHEAKTARRGCWGYSAPATGPARFVRQPITRPALTGGGSAGRVTAYGGLGTNAPPEKKTAETKPTTTKPGKEAKPPAPAPEETPPAIEEEESLAFTDHITLLDRTPIYTLRDLNAAEPLLHLEEGEEVQFLTGLNAERAKVRFILSGKPFEGAVTFSDLGLTEAEESPLILDEKGGTWGAMLLPKPTPIYRINPAGQPAVIGHLPAETPIHLRGNFNPHILHVSFTLPDGRPITGLARIADLRE